MRRSSEVRWKALPVSFDLLDQDSGLDAVEVRQILVEHHLTFADDEDPLLDRTSAFFSAESAMSVGCQTGRMLLSANRLYRTVFEPPVGSLESATPGEKGSRGRQRGAIRRGSRPA